MPRHSHHLSKRVLQAEEIASRGGKAQPAAVDVADDKAVADALERHLDEYQSLDIVCLNAGIMEPGMPAVNILLNCQDAPYTNQNMRQ